MKKFPFLTKAASGALTAAMILTVGCGQAPETGAPSGSSASAEALQKEIASLKKKLADARSRIDSLRAQLNGASASVVDGGLSAEEIIDELMNVKLTSKNRRAAERRVQFLFESLIQQGDAAVPHIRAFLNKMEDVGAAFG
jgi:chromosome segregation ATPase